MRKRYLRDRTGFTLVELMVAAALTILIMTVISMAFQTGLTTLSHLKSMGDLAERLRIVQDRLRDDLECEHFYRGNSVGQRKLSDIRYDLGATVDGREVPRIGYFRIEQGNLSHYEGLDPANLISTKRPIPGDLSPADAIEFTIWRKTNEPDKMMSTTLQATESAFVQEQTATDKSLGADNYVAEWARVRWQLKAQSSINGVQLYSLHRCVRYLANGNRTDGSFYTTANPATSQIMSVEQVSNIIQRADRATASDRRPEILIYDAASGKLGDDLVLTNVVSFEVKPTWSAYTGPGAAFPHNQLPRTTLAPTNPAISNTDYPFDDLPLGAIPGARVFDTHTRILIPGPTPTTGFPLQARITGLQIKIRVYEPKNNMTRQSTIIVKL